MKYLLLLIAFLISATNIFSQEKRDVTVTIYNSNTAVVKETRDINLQKGVQTISVSGLPATINPATAILDIDASVIEMNSRISGVELYTMLHGLVGKRVILTHNESPQSEVSGTLLHYDGTTAIIQEGGGKLTYIRNLDYYRISVLDANPNFSPQPSVEWTLNSPSAGTKKADITYQLYGMSWSANYNATLKDNDRKLDLLGLASITNSTGTDFRNAGIRLVAGDVNRVAAGNQMLKEFSAVDNLSRSEAAYAPQMEESPSFEYHVYNLNRKADLLNNQSKQLSLVEANDIPVIKKYMIRSGYYYYSRGPEQKPQGVEVTINFKNEKKNNLGIPLPAGTFRVYKEENGAPMLLGEDMIKHTAENEELNISVGRAFDITFEEQQTDSRQISEKINEQSFEIKIRNEKDENVEVVVQRNLGTNWEIIRSNINHTKKNASTVEFNVPVKANSENTLTFTVRYTYR